MSFRHVANIVGLLLVFVGLAMTTAGVVSLRFGDGDALAFFGSAAITMLAGGLSYRYSDAKDDFGVRDGYGIVTSAWVAMGVFGALPLWLGGSVDGYIPALFEAVSGFTTTGATVFTDIESLSHGILFWRSLTHWIGGMGIIVLAIAILPFLGVGGMQLFQAEVPGPTAERLRPRITQTAKLLWYVYVGLTAVQTLLYWLGGMSLFDAVTHSFSTLATGGFSTRNASMAAFDSRYLHYVTIVFMYLAGVNFALHFKALSGRAVYWRDAEWRFFTAVLVSAGVALTALNLAGGSYDWSAIGMEAAFRDGLFQAASITTTTGFVSADYELWIPAAQALVIALFFVGGMAGSTGGGIKAIRLLLMFKHSANQLRQQLHPRAVLLARVGRKVVSEDVMARVMSFVVLYFLLIAAGVMALALLGMDLASAIGASAATVGNIGPGIGDVGPTDNYGWMSHPALIVLSFLMLVGRLEIYTVLILFHPDIWRRRAPVRPARTVVADTSAT